MDTSGTTVLKPGSGGQDKTGNPFSKDELNSILKFGAEELFKEEDDREGNEEPACDIDEILRRAETRAEEQADDDELMSGFKVASFAVDEDDAVQSAKSGDGGGIQKLWDEIIPSNIREELEEEERQKELAEMYLGPRQRKTVLGGENKENENKRKRNKSNGESSEAEEKAEADDSETPPTKKRKDDKIKGFNDAEIRRFIKSYKKFALPLTRMIDIAEDADLSEKPQANLVDLGRILRDRCVEALEQNENEKVESIKIGKVSVNPKTLIENEALLRPLGKIIPKESERRKDWSLEIHLKDAHFDVAWGVEEDSKLLLGIWEHGLGSWEQVKSDRDLDLGGKILLNASCKPQSKHLDVRAAYLLRMLQRKSQVDKPEKKKKPKATNKESSEDQKLEYKSKEIVEDEDSSDEERKKKVKKEKKKKDKEDKKKEKVKRPEGTVHIGTSDIILKSSELDPEIFSQCKEKMRDVKKSLKALDKPDSKMSQEEQVTNTRKCLVKIGRHIDSLLEPMVEDKAKEWSSHLWLFVSNFTDFDAKKLLKLYRHASKRDEDRKESSQEKDERKSKDKEKHKKKHKEKHRDREGRKSQENDSSERKERIAPPRPDRDSSYRAASDNGDRRDNSHRGYHHERGGYNSFQGGGYTGGGDPRNYDRAGQGGYSGGYRGYKERGYGGDRDYQRGGERWGGHHNSRGDGQWRDRGGGHNRAGYYDDRSGRERNSHDQEEEGRSKDDSREDGELE